MATIVAEQLQQQANMATNQYSATPAKLVEFTHADLFSPAISTLQKSLDRNYIHHFMGLTSETLKKYPP